MLRPSELLLLGQKIILNGNACSIILGFKFGMSAYDQTKTSGILLKVQFIYWYPLERDLPQS